MGLKKQIYLKHLLVLVIFISSVSIKKSIAQDGNNFKNNSVGIELYGKTYLYNLNYRRYFPLESKTSLLLAGELGFRYGGVFHELESPLSLLAFYSKNKLKPMLSFGCSFLFHKDGSKLTRDEFLANMERNFEDYPYVTEFALSYFAGLGLHYDITKSLYLETMVYGVAPFQYDSKKAKREIGPSLGLNFGFKF